MKASLGSSSPYLVFWSSTLNIVHLSCQLYKPLACSPNTSMQDAVFGIICFKVLLIGMLLFCTVDGPVLPARSRVLSPSVSLTPKASSSQECTRLEKIRNGKGLTGGNLVLLPGLGIQNLERKQDMKVMITLFFFFSLPTMAVSPSL